MKRSEIRGSVRWNHKLSPVFRFAPYGLQAQPSNLDQRLQYIAALSRAHRRSVRVDDLFGDLAVAQAKLVDAAEVEALSADDARGLPLDDHHVAARGPVEQLPDEVRRLLLLDVVQTPKLGAGDGAAGERRAQDAVRMP